MHEEHTPVMPMQVEQPGTWVAAYPYTFMASDVKIGLTLTPDREFMFKKVDCVGTDTL